jgi:hypothetical protein
MVSRRLDLLRSKESYVVMQIQEPFKIAMPIHSEVQNVKHSSIGTNCRSVKVRDTLKRGNGTEAWKMYLVWSPS